MNGSGSRARVEGWVGGCGGGVRACVRACVPVCVRAEVSQRGIFSPLPELLSCVTAFSSSTGAELWLNNKLFIYHFWARAYGCVCVSVLSE